MKLYRYEIPELNNTGFLASLEDIFDIDTVWELAWVFEAKLDIPPDNLGMSSTKSYFTEKGNRKFHKAIKNIEKALNGKGLSLTVKTISLDTVKDLVLYQDENQIIILADVA